MAAHPLLCAWIAAAVATPAPEYTRAAAIRLYSAGELVPAAEHMREVYRRPGASVAERRAAAAFVVGAYRAAFEAADDPASAAAYLCNALAVAEDFKQTAGAAAASLTRAHEEVVRLRAPFGPCDPAPASAPDDAPADRSSAPQTATDPAIPGPTTANSRPEPDWLPVPPGRARPGPLAPPLVATTATTRAPSRPSLTWTGVALLGAGAATAAVGIGVGLSQALPAVNRGRALQTGLAGRPPTTEEVLAFNEAYRDVQHAKQVLGVGLAVGGGLMLVGAVLTAIGVRGVRRAHPTKVAMQPGLHRSSITLQWQF